jgi:hypothetical protein
MNVNLSISNDRLSNVRINASNDYWKFYLGRRWDGGKLVCGIAE